ncbi:hypothetical protein CLU79DRAFT_718172 [Phycomyces nitens]|nr:hypothetical protein CLU79DRAFT_718172 [Phycomyces nitens]
MEAIHIDLQSDKKRQSGDYGERDPTEGSVTSATQALRSQYKKHGLYPFSPSASSNPDLNKKSHHKRTPSSQLPLTTKKSHGRQGSLPHNISFKDIRSATPLLSEKNVSIQIADPSSNVIHHHILKHENTLQNLMYILLWYLFSTSLSLYNKNLMGREQFNFNFPLLVIVGGLRPRCP